MLGRESKQTLKNRKWNLTASDIACKTCESGRSCKDCEDEYVKLDE